MNHLLKKNALVAVVALVGTHGVLQAATIEVLFADPLEGTINRHMYNLHRHVNNMRHHMNRCVHTLASARQNSSKCITERIVQEKDKTYLELTVHGIASANQAPKEILKKKNGIAITTDRGSVSVEQHGDRVTFDVQRASEIEQDGIKQSSKSQERTVKSLTGTIKFDQAASFDILPGADGGGHIFVRLPLEGYKNPQEKSMPQQAEKTTYSFNTGMPVKTASAAAATTSEK